MIKSMTGYGKVKLETNNKVLNLEIRTLNSKQLDLNLRMPYLYKEKELELRSLLGQKLIRGKIDCSINIEQSVVNSGSEINQQLAKNYFTQLNELSNELDIKGPDNPISLLMGMPDIFSSSKEKLNQQEWDEIILGMKETIDQVIEFRTQEGLPLHGDFVTRINIIKDLLGKVEPFEKERVPRIRERIVNNLNNHLEDVSKSSERLEQEMIFYMEKLDITEEKVRLSQHCDYFLEIINSEENAGKKLGFVTQEIGREINTLGSKANDINLQKIVVLMKDELEKIKEQLFNIL
ncbi:MAG: YicC family protein [Bacteroidetes bacterium]|nr:MAG: YicC family protein [Bacteroidota bacterium]